MATVLKVQLTSQGLLIPKQALEGLGEVEAVRNDYYIIIRPKNVTERMSGFINSPLSVEEALEDYELSMAQLDDDEAS
jgi:hypothetical protein